MNKPTALLQVNDLRIAIKGHIAVDGISFRLDQGEIVGIVGESGCGKSLTALSIPGLLPRFGLVSGGNIVFQGRELTGLAEKELRAIRGKEISMVFQEPLSSLNPLVKIGRQITEPLELHGEKDRGRNEERAIKIMESLGLQEPAKLLRLYPHQLSGGMCQRVMIALAMIAGPRLLVADEPTTALDVSTQAQILELLKKINRETGTSILFISHDLSVISRLCHRVLVMYSGKIVEEGAVEEVFTRPCHEYTRGLLGSLPDRQGKGKALANIPGRVPSIEAPRPPGCPFAPRCARAVEQCNEGFPAKVSPSPQHHFCCVLAGPQAAQDWKHYG
jgi:peptide/nickel transport system ATP-binding protein